MTSKRVKKYRLFFLHYSEENLRFATGFRFSRVTPDYILIYHKAARITPPFGKVTEVRQEDLKNLSDMDREWILDCGRSVFTDIMAENSAKGAEKLAEMVDRLGKELEAEAAREEGEGA